MMAGRHTGLQAIIFFLVSSTFMTIYITQPVLPVIRSEFGVSESYASLTISAVIFGIALATLPFGRLVDTFPMRPILFTGGFMVVGSSLFCAVTRSLPLLVCARFLQGVFIPSLTTCLVVYLVRSLPPERLNVVMGSYVSATVLGGLVGSAIIAVPTGIITAELTGAQRRKKMQEMLGSRNCTNCADASGAAG